jgi:hypothetical protein
MKTLTIIITGVIFLAVGLIAGWRLAITCHQPRFEHHAWAVSQFSGTYSIYAYGAVNGELESKIREITGSFDARAFVIPHTGFYQLYYYIPNSLTQKEDRMMHEFVQERLGHYDLEYESFFREEGG